VGGGVGGWGGGGGRGGGGGGVGGGGGGVGGRCGGVGGVGGAGWGLGVGGVGVGGGGWVGGEPTKKKISHAHDSGLPEAVGARGTSSCPVIFSTASSGTAGADPGIRFNRCDRQTFVPKLGR